MIIANAFTTKLAVFLILLLISALHLYIVLDLNKNFDHEIFPPTYFDTFIQPHIVLVIPPFSYSFTWVISVSGGHQSDVALAIFGSREDWRSPYKSV